MQRSLRKRGALDSREFAELEKTSIEVSNRISEVSNAALAEKLPTKVLNKIKVVYDKYLSDVETTIQRQISRIKANSEMKEPHNSAYHDACRGTYQGSNPWVSKKESGQSLYDEIQQRTDAENRAKKLTFLQKARDAVFSIFK